MNPGIRLDTLWPAVGRRHSDLLCDFPRPPWRRAQGRRPGLELERLLAQVERASSASIRSSLTTGGCWLLFEVRQDAASGTAVPVMRWIPNRRVVRTGGVAW